MARWQVPQKIIADFVARIIPTSVWEQHCCKLQIQQHCFSMIRGMAAVSLEGWRRPVTPETARSSSPGSWHKVRLDVKSRSGSVHSLRLRFVRVGLFMPYGEGSLKKNLHVLPVSQELFWLFFFNCLTCLALYHAWAIECKFGTYLFWNSIVVRLFQFCFYTAGFPPPKHMQGHKGGFNTNLHHHGRKSSSQQSKHFGKTGWESTSSISLVITLGIHVYPELRQFLFNFLDQSKINFWISGK